MKLSDLFQFRIKREHIEWILERLNDDLEKQGQGTESHGILLTERRT
jgi:hypothetical protein